MFVFFLLLGCFAATNAEYLFETKYLDVPVDHFSYTRSDTFKLRYLVNDTYFKNVIFFYTGNEMDVNSFAQNTGFMMDIAPTFGALIVFAEHRYYGTSLPFGNLSYSSPEYLGYLTSGQAMADYVYLIDHLQKSYDKKLPVVLFGGSYGGMLSAWMRIKYPSSSIGAIASSAPILQFQGITECGVFNKIVTEVFRNVGTSKCVDTISKSWQIIRNHAKTDQGKSDLTKLFKLCKPLTSEDVDTLINWLANIYVNLVMVNYPYPADFLAPLPADPVRVFCSKMSGSSTDNETLTSISNALEVYTNYTTSTICNDITVTSTDLGELGWYFQACTEIIMPMCSTESDMFETVAWNFTSYSEDCNKKYKVRPARADLPILEYGGDNLKFASNIVFSNGLMDPWSGGGVMRNVSSSVHAVLIPMGTHHSDLRAANPADGEDVVMARQFHQMMIHKWIMEYITDQQIRLH